MKTRKKRSIIWTTPLSEFLEIVKSSKSIADICRHFKFGIKGSIYKTIHARLKEDNIDTSHFEKRDPAKWQYVTQEEFMLRLKENTPSLDRGWIKRKLLEFELVKNECAECQLGPYWNNKPLVLHLDHINGDDSDNRLENLRLMCPNCHTQTPTFSMGKRKKKEYFCKECGDKTEGYASRCQSCGHKSRRKVERPSKDVLEKMVNTMSMVDVAAHFGITDNGIRKWCKCMDIRW